MPLGSRVRGNNVFGLVNDNPLIAAATAMNSNGLANLPGITSTTQHAIITLDPLRVNGAPEIVVVTVHASLATVATITRGAFGTTARSHPQGTLWTHTPMNEDYVSIITSTTRPTDPYIGEIVYETDTGVYSGWNGSGWASIGGTSAGVVTLGYADIQADTATTTSNADAGVQVTVTVPAGRRLRVTAQALLQGSTNGDGGRLQILEGATVLMLSDTDVEGSKQETIHTSVILSPTAGSHTYKMNYSRWTGAGTIKVLANAQYPAYVLVEDITGSATPFATQNVPVGIVARSQVTANQTGITAETDLTGLSINIVVPAGRNIRLTGWMLTSRTVGDGTNTMRIRESATQIVQTDEATFSTDAGTMFTSVVISPSAGSHTYRLTLARPTGTGTVSLLADPTYPAYIMAEDITPTPTANSNAPSSTLAYSEVTANQGSITATVDLIGLSATVTVPAGRRIRILGKVSFSDTAADNRMDLNILEGATILQRAFVQSATTSTNAQSVEAIVIISPSAGTHTYKLTAARATGAGTVTMEAGTDFPAYILVEDITGAVWPSGSQVTSGIIASEAWTPYTPTLSNITIGNGTRGGRYMRIGRTIHAVGFFTMGTTSSVSGRPSIGLPFAAAAQGLGYFGSGRVLDAGNVEYAATVRLSDTGVSEVMFLISGVSAPNGVYNSTTPFAMGTGDSIEFSITYEAAS